MTTVTEDRGRLNLYAKEPPMEIIDVYETHNEKAEKLNGRLAMLGVMAALGAYAITGQIIPGSLVMPTDITVQKLVVQRRTAAAAKLKAKNPKMPAKVAKAIAKNMKKK